MHTFIPKFGLGVTYPLMFFFGTMYFYSNYIVDHWFIHNIYGRSADSHGKILRLTNMVIMWFLVLFTAYNMVMSMITYFKFPALAQMHYGLWIFYVCLLAAMILIALGRVFMGCISFAKNKGRIRLNSAAPGNWSVQSKEEIERLRFAYRQPVSYL
eukprot:GEZU01000369.1.p2 GENE.GEZU01000369.1~~GEZU01000369.1.p2  ORF type:complete len:156 (+),score=41.28 GEZU01000369.1:68-535(+)